MFIPNTPTQSIPQVSELEIIQCLKQKSITQKLLDFNERRFVEHIHDTGKRYISKRIDYCDGESKKQIVDDIIQDAMHKLWKNLPGFEIRVSIKEFYKWWFRIIFHAIVDYLKKQKLNDSSEEPEQSVEDNVPYTSQLLREIITYIEQSYSIEEAKMFLDRCINGMTLKELSSCYGLPTSTIDDRIRKIRGSIQQEFGA